MPKCPFAIQKPVSGPSGSYKSGPYRIVHHTTEGTSASAAMAAYAAKRADPHFTVDRTNIYQHIDTGPGARALRNGPSGVETNRLSAVQIEVVGFAGKPKEQGDARQCRAAVPLDRGGARRAEGVAGGPAEAGDGGGQGSGRAQSQRFDLGRARRPLRP